MTTDIDATLNESLRDAMLAMYLHDGVNNDPYLIEQGLADRIKTPDDLYEFWLLDVLVTQNVPTSPVACAIASLQQLINSMMLNMEPGYADHSLSPAQVNAWRNGMNRYPTWAALQQLHHFPDIYLDPTLRLSKTSSFEQLENDLNQTQIQPQTVQAAVLAYLARFEEVANLKLCNGYIDGEDFANSCYYFIARSPAENAFYWRVLDMAQRPQITPAAGPGEIAPKYDKPLPSAWSDWQRANVPISEKALEHTIRPCWFNNRLFVVWAELDYQDPDAISPGADTQNSVKAHPLFRLYGSYKKYDDSWSTPRVYIENYCLTPSLIDRTPEEIARQTQTIAVYDHSTSPESMFIALYSHYQPDPTDPTGGSDHYDFLRTVRIDKNFNVTSLFPASGVVPEVTQNHRTTALQDDAKTRAHVLLIGNIFANASRNARRLQYWLPSGTPIFGDVEPATPDKDETTWNFNGWQQRIRHSAKNVDLVYDRSRSNIELSVRLDEGFSDEKTITLSIFDRSTPTLELFQLTLVFSESSYHGERYTLSPGSTITASNTEWLDQANAQYSFTTSMGWKNLILDNVGAGDKFSLPRTKKGESASLAGKRLYKRMLEELINSPINYLTECRRYTNSTDKLYLHPKVQHESFGPYFYQLFVAHPLDVTSATHPTSFSEMRTLHRSPILSSLARDATLSYAFSIDQTTHRPEGWPVDWPEDPADLSIPLIYGVLVYEQHLNIHTLKGGALNALKVGWGETLQSTPLISPSLNSLSDPAVGDSPSLGKAQFIDFSGSSIEANEAPDSVEKRAPIRMNTTFARHLIERAETGMHSLLSWDTQHMKEPPITDESGAQAMDFSGAYSPYFVELFLYLPWLVAHRLNQEQQYEEAPAGQGGLEASAPQQLGQRQQIGHRQTEQAGDACLAEQGRNGGQVALEYGHHLLRLCANQQQRIFSRLQAQAGAQLQQRLLVGRGWAAQFQLGLIEDQRRVEQLYPVEHLVEQRDFVLAAGIGREVVQQRGELLRVDAMALVEVAIDAEHSQGVFVELHAQVGLALGADRAGDQGVQFGEGDARPALQANHPLQAIEAIERGLGQARGFRIAHFDLHQVHGVVEFVAQDRSGCGRGNAVVQT